MDVYELAEMRGILAQDERYCGYKLMVENADSWEYILIDQHGNTEGLVEYMVTLWAPDKPWWIVIPKLARGPFSIQEFHSSPHRRVALPAGQAGRASRRTQVTTPGGPGRNAPGFCFGEKSSKLS